MNNKVIKWLAARYKDLQNADPRKPNATQKTLAIVGIVSKNINDMYLASHPDDKYKIQIGGDRPMQGYTKEAFIKSAAPLPPYPGPSKDSWQGPAMQESFNGKFRMGDQDKKTGKYMSHGLLHMYQVPDSDLKRYNKARQGKSKTYFPVVDDVNDNFGTNYTADDVFNDKTSIDIYNKFQTMMGRKFQKQHGRYPTKREERRFWNGSHGYDRPGTREKTLTYADNVEAKLRNPAHWGLTPGKITPANPEVRPQMITPGTYPGVNVPVVVPPSPGRFNDPRLTTNRDPKLTLNDPKLMKRWNTAYTNQVAWPNRYMDMYSRGALKPKKAVNK